VREVESSRVSESQRPAKSYTALQAVRHRFNIYAGSCFALALLWHGDGHSKLVTRFGVIWQILKGLVMEYFARNNQGRGQKNFQEGAREKKRAIVHQESLPLLAVAD